MRLVGIVLLALCAMSTSAEDGVEIKNDGAMQMWTKSRVTFDPANRTASHWMPPNPRGYKSQGQRADLVHKKQEGKAASLSYSTEAREAHGAWTPMEKADHSDNEEHRSAMRQYRKAFPPLSTARPSRKRPPTRLAPPVGNSDRTGGWGTTADTSAGHQRPRRRKGTIRSQ